MKLITMEVWPSFLLIVASLILAQAVENGEVQQCLKNDNTRSEIFILDESSWELMLQGEWMIGFCVPMVMACIKFDRVWSKFAVENQQEQSSKLIVASMKLEYSETLIRRFSLNDLPTVLHVKDGVFRKLPPVQSVAELKEQALTKWRETEPLPFWLHPNGLIINAYTSYIRAVDMIYYSHWLDFDYEHAKWLVSFGLALVASMAVALICSIYGLLRDLRRKHKLAIIHRQRQQQKDPNSDIDHCEGGDANHKLRVK